MIPAEFNKDAAAARRRLQQVDEAQKFKVGQWVEMTGSLAQQMKREGLATYGQVLSVRKLQGNTHLKVRWSDGGDRGVLGSNVRVVKEEYISEKASIVAADNKTGKVILLIASGKEVRTSAEQAIEDRYVAKVKKAITDKLQAQGRGFTLSLEKMPGVPLRPHRYWSLKIDGMNSPTEVSRWLRKEVGSVFK